MNKTKTTLSFIFILVTCYSGLMYFFSPPTNLNVEEKKFFANKFLGTTTYPCLITGDSRVYRGLDTDQFSNKLGVLCYNLGFDSAGFSTSFFDLIEHRFSKDQKRILIIGVSPHAFTERAAENGQLNEYFNMPSSKVQQIFNPQIWDFLFPSLAIDQVFRFNKNQSEQKLIQTYLGNGFAPARQKVNDPKEAISSYQHILKEHSFSLKVEEFFLNALKKLRSENIEIYVLRIPVSNELRDVENQLSAFNEKKLIEELRNENINWIQTEGTYETFDGSHLTGDGARLFSTDVLEKILKNKK